MADDKTPVSTPAATPSATPAAHPVVNPVVNPDANVDIDPATAQAIAPAVSSNPPQNQDSSSAETDEDTGVSPQYYTIEQAARNNGVPPEILHAQAKQESNFHQSAVSPKGAEGVMQLKPSTAADLGVNPQDETQNIHGGAQYMKQLHQQFGTWDRALAAYNWGPHNLHEALQQYGDQWFEHAPDETKDYVKKIMSAKPIIGPVQEPKPHGVSGSWGPAAPEKSKAKQQFQGLENWITEQEAQNAGEAQYKNWLYKNKPDEYKQAHPVDYYNRRAHELIMNAVLSGNPALNQPHYREQVKELVDLGSSIYGLPPAKENPEPTLKQGIIMPEGGMEEGEIPENGKLSAVEGAITTKPPAKVGALDTIEGGIRTKNSDIEHYAYRARDVGEQGVPSKSLAQATTNEAEVHQIAKNREDVTGKPQEVVKIPLHSLKSDDYTAKAAPRGGGNWIKFNRDLEENEVQPHSAEKQAQKSLGETETTAATQTPKGISEHHKSIVDAAGGVYKKRNSDGLTEIALPRSMTDKLPNVPEKLKDFVTITMPESEITSPEAVKARMEEKFRQFKGETKPPAQASE